MKNMLLITALGCLLASGCDNQTRASQSHNAGGTTPVLRPLTTVTPASNPVDPPSNLPFLSIVGTGGGFVINTTGTNLYGSTDLTSTNWTLIQDNLGGTNPDGAVIGANIGGYDMTANGMAFFLSK